MNTTTNAPIAPQSAFARPAALIGGAVALVAVTAIATTLTLQSAPPRPQDSANGASPMMALSTPAGKAGSTTPPEAPADFPDKMSPAPKADAKPAPKAAPRTVHIQQGSVKAVEPTQHAVSVCATCGKVESVNAVTQKGEGTGIGAVGGAVVGGLLGHQIGGGNGKNVATVLGAVGGGVAGNEIEKRQRATTVYQVKVRMDDGSLRTVTQSTAPAIGEKVTVEGSTLRSRSSAS